MPLSNTLHSTLLFNMFQKHVETFQENCHSVSTKASWVIYMCGFYPLLGLLAVAGYSKTCGPVSATSVSSLHTLSQQLQRRANNEMGRSENMSFSGNIQMVSKLCDQIIQESGKGNLTWLLSMKNWQKRLCHVIQHCHVIQCQRGTNTLFFLVNSHMPAEVGSPCEN